MLVVLAVTAGAVVKWGLSSSVSPATAASGNGLIPQLTVPPASAFTAPAGTIPTSPQAGAPTPAEDAAVQAWWALNGTWPTIFLNDQIALRSDQFAPLATTTGASNLLETNLSVALKLAPIPDAAMQSDWKHMVDDYQSAGSSVVEWIYTSGKGGPGSWSQILTEFQRADTWSTDLVQTATAFGVT